MPQIALDTQTTRTTTTTTTSYHNFHYSSSRGSIHSGTVNRLFQRGHRRISLCAEYCQMKLVGAAQGGAVRGVPSSQQACLGQQQQWQQQKLMNSFRTVPLWQQAAGNCPMTKWRNGKICLHLRFVFCNVILCVCVTDPVINILCKYAKCEIKYNVHDHRTSCPGAPSCLDASKWFISMYEQHEQHLPQQ